jgi:CRP-like cAMP-binding protein
MIDPLIRKLERYGPLTEEEKRFLHRAPSQVVAYDPYEPIVREGDTPSVSCLVVEGFAYRFKTLPEGTRQILALHVPGDFCDLHSFVLKSMDHGIAAANRCKVARVPHGKLREITERLPRLTRALWWDTAIDAATHREWMISMGRRDAFRQIAHLLCELLLRLESVGLIADESYELPLTQVDLGDVFGLSAVHVNRMLQRLRSEELITLKARVVTILDREGLMKAAGFEPAYLELGGRPKE